MNREYSEPIIELINEVSGNKLMTTDAVSNARIRLAAKEHVFSSLGILYEALN